MSNPANEQWNYKPITNLERLELTIQRLRNHNFYDDAHANLEFLQETVEECLTAILQELKELKRQK